MIHQLPDVSQKVQHHIAVDITHFKNRFTPLERSHVVNVISIMCPCISKAQKIIRSFLLTIFVIRFITTLPISYPIYITISSRLLVASWLYHQLHFIASCLAHLLTNISLTFCISWNQGSPPSFPFESFLLYTFCEIFISLRYSNASVCRILNGFYTLIGINDGDERNEICSFRRKTYRQCIVFRNT